MYSLCINALFRFSINRRPQYPLVSLWTPLPREGWTKDVIQVLSISTYDYLRNTCLHYIYELELVLHRPRLLLLYDEYHPTNLPI